eukprot:4584391-Amphidinium_carterae.1
MATFTGSSAQRVSKLPYMIGAVLDSIIDGVPALGMVLQTWVRSLELAGVVLYKAGAVPPALPWALALACTALASNAFQVIFETFMRMADANDVELKEVMNSILANGRQFQ